MAICEQLEQFLAAGDLRMVDSQTRRNRLAERLFL